MRGIAVAVAVMLVSLTLAQQEMSRPWRDWRPPTIHVPDPNAYDQYRTAFELLKGFEPPVEDATAAELRASIAGFEQAYSALQQALDGECQFPAPAGMSHAPSDLADASRACQFLVTHAAVDVLDGRMAQAALDCISCVRVGADVATSGSLAAGEVAIDCERLGLNALQAIVPRLKADGCLTALEALRTAEAERVALPTLLQGELASGKLTLQAQFEQIKSPEDDPEQFMALTPEQREEALRQWDETLRQMGVLVWNPAESWFRHEEWFERLIEQTSKPWWEREEVPPTGDPLVDVLLPAPSKVQAQFAVADAKLRLVMCQLAAQAYILKEDETPEDLEALVPDYLPEVPADPFRDAPLASTTRDEQFVIYSVGPDMTDDGGTPIEGDVKEDSKGDLVVAL
ncbi:MAG: hypothetical protein J7M38_00995 [Armatimonadetes bacterium]|nr:hypothetical protein [Armatimonadota bacterium]